MSPLLLFLLVAGTKAQTESIEAADDDKMIYLLPSFSVIAALVGVVAIGIVIACIRKCRANRHHAHDVERKFSDGGVAYAELTAGHPNRKKQKRSYKGDSETVLSDTKESNLNMAVEIGKQIDDHEMQTTTVGDQTSMASEFVKSDTSTTTTTGSKASKRKNRAKGMKCAKRTDSKDVAVPVI